MAGRLDGRYTPSDFPSDLPLYCYADWNGKPSQSEREGSKRWNNGARVVGAGGGWRRTTDAAKRKQRDHPSRHGEPLALGHFSIVTIITIT